MHTAARAFLTTCDLRPVVYARSWWDSAIDSCKCTCIGKRNARAHATHGLFFSLTERYGLHFPHTFLRLLAAEVLLTAILCPCHAFTVACKRVLQEVTPANMDLAVRVYCTTDVCLVLVARARLPRSVRGKATAASTP